MEYYTLIQQFFLDLVPILSPHTELLAQIMLVFSILVSVIGFPMQIWKNYQEGTAGMPFMFVLLGLGVYLTRVPYSIASEAWYILPADMIGLFTTCIMIFQAWLYRDAE